MNSPDENKLYFTKNWQIERALRDSRVRSVQKLEELIEERSGISTRRIFREEEWSKIILKMSNLYAVDNCCTFQFNQRYFSFFVNQEDC